MTYKRYIFVVLCILIIRVDGFVIQKHVAPCFGQCHLLRSSDRIFSNKNVLGSSEKDISNDVDSKNRISIMDRMFKFRSDFSSAAEEGFGTKARNVANTMSVGDIVVPLCGNLAQRQILANRGIYPGVEYQVCSLQLNEQEIISVQDLTLVERQQVTALIKPNYKLRQYLERNDWPVKVLPFEDVPLWLSKSTYEAGTMLGTLGLAFTYLSFAAILAFFVRITYVPSESMFPALKPGDVCLVTRAIGPLRPQVGDVVLFDPPPQLNDYVSSFVDQQNKPRQGEQLLKRVVAKPGEIVGVKNAEPYVVLNSDSQDGTTRKFRVDIIGPYSRPDIFPPSSWDRSADKPLDKNEYFVAGDNGYRSVDSRVWGPLKRQYIFGKAQWVIWPLADFGTVKPGQISLIEK